MGMVNKEIKPPIEGVGKVPPSDIELEATVLGALLIDKNAIHEVIGFIDVDTFYYPKHSVIYGAIQQLYAKSEAIDLISVASYLKSTGNIDLAGGHYYVAKLTNRITSSVNIEYHARILTQLSVKRKLIHYAGELLRESYNTDSDALELLENSELQILEIHQKISKSGVKPISKLIEKNQEERRNYKEKGHVTTATGFLVLDRLFGGWKDTDLIIIAGTPGSGKTSMLLSSFNHFSVTNDQPAAIFTLEMAGEQLTSRLASIRTGISHFNQVNGILSPQQEENLLNEEKTIASSKLLINDEAFSIQDIIALSSYLKTKHGIVAIGIDFVLLMEYVENKYSTLKAHETIGKIIYALKKLAKKLRIPVIALHQFNREGLKTGRPRMEHLYGSSAIEQAADRVIFLTRPDREEDCPDFIEIEKVNYHKEGLVVVEVVKNRHGPTKRFPLHFNGETMKYSDHPDYTGASLPTPSGEMFNPFEKEDGFL